MSYYLTDSSHVLITGATGAGDKYGGKTVLANWWIDNLSQSNDMVLFYNPKGHRFVRGKEVHSLEGLVSKYNAGNRQFNFVPTDTVGDHIEIVEFLRHIPGRKCVVHDEIHAVGDSDLTDWCYRQGGNIGNGSRFESADIRSIGVTQHPWDVPQSVLNNSPLLIWVGPKTQESKRYFQSMQIESAWGNIPDDLPPYHWAVIDGGEVVDINSAVPKEYSQ